MGRTSAIPSNNPPKTHSNTTARRRNGHGINDGKSDNTARWPDATGKMAAVLMAARMTLQMTAGYTVAALNRILTTVMNQNGQGGDFQIGAEELEEIDFNRIYQVRKARRK
jgi:hypothetical protein